MPSNSALGGTEFGGTEFGGAIVTPVVIDSVNSEIIPRNQIGFGSLGQRVYHRPMTLETRGIDVDLARLPAIDISDPNDAFIGKIRLDIQKPILEILIFGLDYGQECRTFKMTLNKLPDFPIPRLSTIHFKIGNEGPTGNWYSGVINKVPEPGTLRKKYVFSGQGFSSYAKQASSEQIISPPPGGSDVGVIVANLVQNDLAPFTPINYNPNKIELNTGAIVVGNLDFSQAKLNKQFDILAEMGASYWGVDGDQDFFLRKKPLPDDTEEKTIFIGWDLHSFSPELNIDEVKNAIIIQRQEGKASGAAGWVIGGVYNDTSSIAKYFKREYNKQVPGFFDQDAIDIIGNALLDAKKEPKFSAKIKGYPIKFSSDFLSLGIYRFILPFSQYPRIHNDMDDSSEWILSGAGDMTKADDTQILFWAASSVKLQYKNAQNQQIVLTQNFKFGKIIKIRCYIRASKIGSYFSIGVGLTTPFEVTTKIDVPISNRFFAFEWNVEDENLTEINKVGFKIDEAGPVIKTDIYLDKLEFEIVGHQFYRLPLERSKYMYQPGKDGQATVEFGILPPELSQFINGLFSQIDELRFTGEIR